MGNKINNLNNITNNYCKITNLNWMKDIPDKTYLTDLTIPGTHNSCANNSSILGCGYVKCQNLTLTHQLEAGIRFLDIRCRHINNCFTMHHEAFYLNKSFGQVLNECSEFLDQNPSEFIIMTIREEYKPEKTKGKSFNDTFLNYYTQFSDYILLTTSIPRVHELRKKIWILEGDNVNLSTYKFKSCKLENSWHIKSQQCLEIKKQKIKDNISKSINCSENMIFT